MKTYYRGQEFPSVRQALKAKCQRGDAGPSIRPVSILPHVAKAHRAWGLKTEEGVIVGVTHEKIIHEVVEETK